MAAEISADSVRTGNGGRRRLSLRARLAAAFFLALGLVAVVIGGHDLLLSAQLTYRIVGAGVVVVGIALVASAVGFARRRAWCYSYSVGGGVAAGVFASMLFVAQWVNAAHGFRLLLWAVLAVVCLAAAVAVGKEGRVSLGGLARRRVQVASSVLSVGALLSIAQFWNAAVRVPPTSAPSLSITTDLEQLPPKGCLTPVAATVKIRKSATTKQLPPKACLTPVAATVKIRNTATSKVWVLGSLYEVWGGSAKASAKSPLEFTDLITDRGINGQLAYGASRHVDEGYTTVVETGNLLSEFTYLVPGEEYTFNLLAYVPPKRYDLLRFEVAVIIAKDTLVLDDTQLDPPRVIEDPAGPRIVIEHDIRETSWLARLLHGRRYARIEVVLHRSNGIMYPGLFVSVDRRGRKAAGADDPEAIRMAHLYGVALSDSWFELALK